MKTSLIKFVFIFLCLALNFPTTETFAQVKHTVVHKKKHSPPRWAPAHGYQAKTRHVYFPAYNCYFDLQKNAYIYLDNGKWLFSVSLPLFLKGVDLKISKHIELDFYSDNPHLHNKDHKLKFKHHVKHKKGHPGGGHHPKGNGKKH